MSFIEIFAKQKFRFDLGASIWVIINFTILIIGFSDKFAKLLPFEADYKTYWTVLIFVPGGLFGIWLLGFILDKLKFQDNLKQQHNVRDPTISEILERVRKIDERDKKNRDD